jgi:hypothetical protein
MQDEVNNEVGNLVAIVNEIITLVGNRSAGVGVSGPGAAMAAGAGQNATVALLQDKVAALCRDFVLEIKSLKMSATGEGPFRIGTHKFDGYSSCERFCRTHGLDKNFFYDFILAPHSMLASLANTTLTLEEYTDTAILTTKTSLTPNQLRVAALFECTYPQIFTGSAKQDVSAAAGIAKFANIKTHEDWDRRDEESGIRNYIKRPRNTHHLPLSSTLSMPLRSKASTSWWIISRSFLRTSSICRMGMWFVLPLRSRSAGNSVRLICKSGARR